MPGVDYGIAADRSGIQFRMLNRRKDQACWGTRTQADRKTVYQAGDTEASHRYVESESIEGEVDDLETQRRGFVVLSV